MCFKLVCPSCGNASFFLPSSAPMLAQDGTPFQFSIIYDHDSGSFFLTRFDLPLVAPFIPKVSAAGSIRDIGATNGWGPQNSVLITSMSRSQQPSLVWAFVWLPDQGGSGVIAFDTKFPGIPFDISTLDGTLDSVDCNFFKGCGPGQGVCNAQISQLSDYSFHFNCSVSILNATCSS